jgi:hypothetical protein
VKKVTGITVKFCSAHKGGVVGRRFALYLDEPAESIRGGRPLQRTDGFQTTMRRPKANNTAAWASARFAWMK